MVPATARSEAVPAMFTPGPGAGFQGTNPCGGKFRVRRCIPRIATAAGRRFERVAETVSEARRTRRVRSRSRILAPLQVRAHRDRIRADAFHRTAYFQWGGAEHPAPVAHACLLLEVDLAHQRHCRHNSRRAELAVMRQVKIAVHRSSSKWLLRGHRNDRAMGLRREIRGVCSSVALSRSASCERRLVQVANCADEKSGVEVRQRPNGPCAPVLADTAMVTNLAAG